MNVRGAVRNLNQVVDALLDDTEIFVHVSVCDSGADDLLVNGFSIDRHLPGSWRQGDH